jgi:hypothetical protein
MFTVEIFDEGKSCSFYSVRKEESENMEAEKFFLNYESESKLKVEFQELVQFVFVKIGDELGAKEYFFRFENDAQALPPTGKIGREVGILANPFPLRLYCSRINEHIVVLYNGGRKTSRTAQAGDTNVHFREANIFAKRLWKAIEDGEIIVDRTQNKLRATIGEEIIVY